VSTLPVRARRAVRHRTAARGTSPSWRDRAVALREQAAFKDRAVALREHAALKDRAVALREQAALKDRAVALREQAALKDRAVALRDRASLERVAVWRRSADDADTGASGDDAPIDVASLTAASLEELELSAAAPPLPEGSRTADLDGPVHYVEHATAGDVDGPPVVCVHGLGGSHANWHDLGPLLARRHRVFALDLAGHGRTPRGGRSAAVRANRELLDRFLREVVGEPAVLVGNSMGGTISLLQAAARPDSVTDLVLIGPAAPRVRTELPDLAVARQAALFAVPGVAEKVLARRRERLGAEGWVREQMTLTTADITRVSAEMRQVAVDLVASRAAGPDTEAAFLEAARSLVALLARGTRYREMVADVPGRALVLHGELDRLVPLSCSQALVEQRPDWRLEVLDGVGHVPQIELPERTADLVLDWLWRDRSADPAWPIPIPEQAGTDPTAQDPTTTAGGAA
jgi:pimeloyl-ACP methyl ester carboxylesterase